MEWFFPKKRWRIQTEACNASISHNWTLQKELNCPKPRNSLFFIANINNGTLRKLRMEDNSATRQQVEAGNFARVQAMSKTI